MNKSNVIFIFETGSRAAAQKVPDIMDIFPAEGGESRSSAEQLPVPDMDNYLSYCFSDPDEVLLLDNPDDLPGYFSRLEEYRKNYYLAGFFSYELGYLFEKKFLLNKTDFPLALFGVYKNPVISRDFPLPCAEKTYEIKKMALNVPEQEYFNNINAVKEYIKNGDIYQANYTVKYKFDFSGSPEALYNDLKKKQTVPLNVFACFDDYYIISLSPELFFLLDKDRITVRPMKGTCARGRTPAEDRMKSEWLRNDAKNRSENVMIVDLMRNDLGRISKQGTVRVKSLYDIEKYDTVFQMTSAIESQIEDNTGIYGLIRSIFPCGSVTGAPKIRSMEIIRELEKEERKIYCGALGFFKPGGNAVFNVAIRTVLLNKGKGEMGTGGGIVYDSLPQAELDECRLKADFLTAGVSEFSLIETMFFDGEFRNPDLHMQRLSESAEYFNFKFDPGIFISRLAETAGILNKLRHHDEEVKFRVRALLNKNGGITFAQTRIENYFKEFKIRLAGKRTDSSNKFLYHKTTNRNIYDAELSDARGMGFFDSVFINEREEITEGAVTNIYIEGKGTLFTPPVECGLLNGTIRRKLIAEGMATEQIIPLRSLLNADNIYISNAVIGFQKAELIR